MPYCEASQASTMGSDGLKCTSKFENKSSLDFIEKLALGFQTRSIWYYSSIGDIMELTLLKGFLRTFHNN